MWWKGDDDVLLKGFFDIYFLWGESIFHCSYGLCEWCCKCS